MAVRAPELAAPSATWFNTDHALSLTKLSGRVVLLDFWTSCCVNCLHVLPALARVEAAFPREVVVVGVHTPKFKHERDPETVRIAIDRLGITHPVLHDPDRRLWDQYAVRAWPTLTFIDPDGYVVDQRPGEPDADELARTVRRMVKQARGVGALRPSSPQEPRDSLPEAARFRYPGKLRPIPGRAADAACWVLADAGHHQVVLLDDSGQVVARIGSGVPGAVDGPPLRAGFRCPQGVAADAEAIWVADTGNHLIRRIDLATGEVAAVAGTGARGGILGPTAPALSTALASPWDLVPYGSGVLFANAGTHQLGALDSEAGELEALAGTGAENLHDGPAHDALLAQPSGLALHGDALLIADSETSAVRRLDLRTLDLRTLAGAGLFAFGHRNGPLAEARLQHPLGVAALDEDTVLVADSYNGVVRVLDLVAGQARDLDDGYLCADPVCLPHGGEPAGVVVDPRAPAGDPRILVVETNRHRIMEYRPARRRYRTWSA